MEAYKTKCYIKMGPCGLMWIYLGIRNIEIFEATCFEISYGKYWTNHTEPWLFFGVISEYIRIKGHYNTYKVSLTPGNLKSLCPGQG